MRTLFSPMLLLLVFAGVARGQSEVCADRCTLDVGFQRASPCRFGSDPGPASGECSDKCSEYILAWKPPSIAMDVLAPCAARARQALMERDASVRDGNTSPLRAARAAHAHGSPRPDHHALLHVPATGRCTRAFSDRKQKT
jgi:hypothetical protein